MKTRSSQRAADLLPGNTAQMSTLRRRVDDISNSNFTKRTPHKANGKTKKVWFEDQAGLPHSKRSKTDEVSQPSGSGRGDGLDEEAEDETICDSVREDFYDLFYCLSEAVGTLKNLLVKLVRVLAPFVAVLLVGLFIVALLDKGTDPIDKYKWGSPTTLGPMDGRPYSFVQQLEKVLDGDWSSLEAKKTQQRSIKHTMKSVRAKVNTSDLPSKDDLLRHIGSIISKAEPTKDSISKLHSTIIAATDKLIAQISYIAATQIRSETLTREQLQQSFRPIVNKLEEKITLVPSIHAALEEMKHDITAIRRLVIGDAEKVEQELDEKRNSLKDLTGQNQPAINQLERKLELLTTVPSSLRQSLQRVELTTERLEFFASRVELLLQKLRAVDIDGRKSTHLHQLEDIERSIEEIQMLPTVDKL